MGSRGKLWEWYWHCDCSSDVHRHTGINRGADSELPQVSPAWRLGSGGPQVIPDTEGLCCFRSSGVPVGSRCVSLFVLVP